VHRDVQGGARRDGRRDQCDWPGEILIRSEVGVVAPGA
jgi:hypothetical protein